MAQEISLDCGVSDSVVNDFSGCLRVLKGQPGPEDVAMYAGHDLALFAPTLGASLLRGQRLLSLRQPIGRGASVPWVGDVAAVRVGGEVRHSDIDTHDGASGLQHGRGDLITREDHVPPLALPLQRESANPPLHRSVLVDANMADALEVDPLGVVPAASITIAHPRHRVPAISGLKSREAGSATSLDPTKERSEGSVQAPHGGHLRPSAPLGLLGQHRPDLFDLSRLAGERDRLPAPFPGPDPFLKGRVVELAVSVEAVLHSLGLTLGGSEQELVRPAHSVPILLVGCSRKSGFVGSPR